MSTHDVLNDHYQKFSFDLKEARVAAEEADAIADMLTELGRREVLVAKGKFFQKVNSMRSRLRIGVQMATAALADMTGAMGEVERKIVQRDVALKLKEMVIARDMDREVEELLKSVQDELENMYTLLELVCELTAEIMAIRLGQA
jgi:Mg2+ and Co2+ transporter CorA